MVVRAGLTCADVAWGIDVERNAESVWNEWRLESVRFWTVAWTAASNACKGLRGEGMAAAEAVSEDV